MFIIIDTFSVMCLWEVCALSLGIPAWWWYLKSVIPNLFLVCDPILTFQISGDPIGLHLTLDNILYTLSMRFNLSLVQFTWAKEAKSRYSWKFKIVNAVLVMNWKKYFLAVFFLRTNFRRPNMGSRPQTWKLRCSHLQLADEKEKEEGSRRLKPSGVHFTAQVQFWQVR